MDLIHANHSSESANVRFLHENVTRLLLPISNRAVGGLPSTIIFS